MSIARDRALVARMKLDAAERLITEACAELQGALPTGHPLVDDACSLVCDVRRAMVLTAQAIKRIP